MTFQDIFFDLWNPGLVEDEFLHASNICRDGDLNNAARALSMLTLELIEPDFSFILDSIRSWICALQYWLEDAGASIPTPAVPLSEIAIACWSAQWNQRNVRIDQVCEEHEIKSPDSVRIIKAALDELSHFKLPHARLCHSQRYYEDLPQDEQEKYRASITRIRRVIMREIYRSKWRDELGAFNFTQLPAELRLHVLSYLVPSKQLKPRHHWCFLGAEKVVVTTNALPSLPVVPHDGTQWDNEHEMVASPMSTSIGNSA